MEKTRDDLIYELAHYRALLESADRDNAALIETLERAIRDVGEKLAQAQR
jgi:hypothetical protein